MTIGGWLNKKAYQTNFRAAGKNVLLDKRAILRQRLSAPV
jgi:hypothetical protein